MLGAAHLHHRFDSRASCLAVAVQFTCARVEVSRARRALRQDARPAMSRLGTRRCPARCSRRYTSLFGAYSSYLFLRTGLVVGPLIAHVFCNLMGLPVAQHSMA
jgi:hypothetical protein